ncbi:hypothetical protein BC939DRAFT_506728 [Gamsiella multidivaricata]|uniref:uncharacterized protein n=1 Tax=Gamsiella multidivaricata TaxID=101098 RepID=UPI00221FE893|nr:uncharacterized protein BC939DRAFT_506728 [Gamsiella multidivaricata]KAI7818219.1 hypothetical protein BC939DRAFT_506728 [Gamsiella multidivaricata]
MSLVFITYGLSITTIVLFDLGALYLAYRSQRVKKDPTESFLTARRSVPEHTPSPGPSMPLVLAPGSSSPCLHISGDSTLHYPHDHCYSGHAFGHVIALCVEYTSIGNLLDKVIGGSQMPIVIVVSVVSSVYTAAGGLYVSILTDVAQGAFGVAPLLIMVIYCLIPRTLVFLINVPIVIVSLKDYNIVILFLIGYLVCTSCAIPLLLGLITQLERIATGWSMVSGIVTGFLSIVVFDYLKKRNMPDCLHYTFAEPSVEMGIRKAFGLAYPIPLALPPEAAGSEHGKEGPGSRATLLQDVEYATEKSFTYERK